MDKTEIESILVANWYFTSCKLSSSHHNCEKTQLAKKYLINKIKKALSEKSQIKTNSGKAFSFLSILSGIRLIF
jgi:hypothetical protein